MKRALLIVFGVVVLAFVASSVALAGEATEPVLVTPPEAAAAPGEPAVVAPAPDLSPDLGAIFLDSADDAAFQVCCQGAFATCAASCGGDVSAYSCSHVGSRGCSSSCTCG
jgi:hypothetical protein